MRQQFGSMLIGLTFVLSVSGATANEHVAKIIANKPTRVACEITPRGDAQQSFLVFYAAGFNERGAIRYRSITLPIVEIRISADGNLMGENSPCLNEPVGLD